MTGGMFQIRTMITYCLVMALLATGTKADEDLELKVFEEEDRADPRLFFANFTSSLIQGGILWFCIALGSEAALDIDRSKENL